MSNLLAHLRALEHLLANRTVVTRVVVAPDGQEVGRITRVQAPQANRPNPKKGPNDD